MDLISIIIPAYNVELYIERCICSVLDQTYTNLEIIIVNDGSTDSTCQICEKLALRDKRISFISQGNEGQSAARNKGLDHANGKWIFFLDSDDWLALETLESMHDCAEKMSADIVCCGIQYAHTDGTLLPFTIGEDKVCHKNEALHDMMCCKNICTVVWNKLYKKSIWDEIRFPHVRFHEDEFVTYKALYASNKVVFIQKPYYHYLQRSNSIMDSRLQVNFLDKLKAIEERTQFFIDHGEEGLVDDSCLEGITYVKYLYRLNMIDLQDDNTATELYHIYLRYKKLILNRKKVDLYKKLTALFWQIFLPIQYKVKKR